MKVFHNLFCNCSLGAFSWNINYSTWTSLPVSPSSFPLNISPLNKEPPAAVLQANMSWWWVSSKPSPRSQSSVRWRWQTSLRSPRSTGGCGSWRWRICSRCWPECRANGGRKPSSCHGCPDGCAAFKSFLTVGTKYIIGLNSRLYSVRLLIEVWCQSDKDRRKQTPTNAYCGYAVKWDQKWSLMFNLPLKHYPDLDASCIVNLF